MPSKTLILVLASLVPAGATMAQADPTFAPASNAATTGLAPAERPYNNDEPSLAGQIIPSSQDTAAHNPAISDRDKLPTIAHTFNFTTEQRQFIRDSLKSEKSAKAPGFPIGLSSEVSGFGEFLPIPASVAEKMPWVKPYRFVKLDDKILIVDSNLPIVVAVIQ